MNPISTYSERRSEADPYVQFKTPESFGIPFNPDNGSRISASVLGHLKYAPRRPQIAKTIFVTIHLTSAGNIRNFGVGAAQFQTQALNNRTDPYVEAARPPINYFDVAAEQRYAKLTKVALPKSRLERRKKSALDDFLHPVMSLEKSGHIDSALDVLYDRVDGLLKTKHFSVLDELFQQAKPNQMSCDVILGLLTASLPARTRLSARPAFFKQAEEYLKTRADWENGLLAGLE